MKRIGHQDIKFKHNGYEKTYNNLANEGHNNSIEKVKLESLRRAHLFIKYVTHTSPMLKELIDTKITQIQSALNNEDLHKENFIADIKNFIIDEKIEETKSKNINLRIKNYDVSNFVDDLTILAAHNTSSQTKINWFTITNETRHIQMLKNTVFCENYLKEHSNFFSKFI